MTLRRVLMTAILGFALVFVSGWFSAGDGSVDSFLCTLLPEKICRQVSWLEAISWTAVVIAAIIGLMALVQQLSQARATFLLGLERQWEAVQKPRQQVTELLEGIKKATGTENADYGDERRMAAVRKECLNKIGEVWKTDYGLYYELLQYLGFFETVGLMVNRRYIPLKDIIALYRGPINDIDIVFGDHITDLQEHMGVKDGLYEYARKLIWWTRRYDHLPWRLLIDYVL